MGWKEGAGLGLGGFGRVDPVPISDKRGSDLTGIGKTSLDTRTIASSTASRRIMESERQITESELDKEKRMALVETKQAQKEEVTQALKTYRCELCQKQYDRPSTFEAHLNSYDHHHKKRFMEMKANQRGKDEAAGMLDKKREREKKREEKEMAKMAMAAGIQLSGVPPRASVVTASSSQPPVISPPQKDSSSSSTTGGGGWKKVVSTKSSFTPTTLPSQPSSSTTSTTGWKNITTQSKGWSTVQPEAAAVKSKTTSLFQSSGFSVLDTSLDTPAQPPSEAPSPPPPPPPDDAPPLPPPPPPPF